MPQTTPKTTIVQFREESPNNLVPDPKHVVTLAKRVGNEHASGALTKVRDLLHHDPTVFDVAVWADDENIVRGRVQEIGQTS